MDRIMQRVYTDDYYGEICDSCWKRKQRETKKWNVDRDNLPPEYR